MNKYKYPSNPNLYSDKNLSNAINNLSKNKKHKV